jgi:SUZ domain
MNGNSVHSITNDEYDSRPPPQILRRDRNSKQEAEQAAAIAAANAAKQKKSLAEREKEYKLARERIFGGKVDASTTTSTTKSTPSQSRNGSGSDTGGRNSPNINVKGKKIR